MRSDNHPISPNLNLKDSSLGENCTFDNINRSSNDNNNNDVARLKDRDAQINVPKRRNDYGHTKITDTDTRNLGTGCSQISKAFPRNKNSTTESATRGTLKNLSHSLPSSSSSSASSLSSPSIKSSKFLAKDKAKKGRKLRKNYTLPPKPSTNDIGYPLEIRKFKAAKEYLYDPGSTSLKEVSKKFKISVPTLITYMDAERVKEFVKTGKYSARSALRAKRDCKNQYNEHAHKKTKIAKRNSIRNTIDTNNKNDKDRKTNNLDLVTEYNINNTDTGNEDDGDDYIDSLDHVSDLSVEYTDSPLLHNLRKNMVSRTSAINDRIENYDTPIFANNENYSELSDQEEQENQNRYRVESFRKKSTDGLNTDEKVSTIKKIINDMKSDSSNHNGSLHFSKLQENATPDSNALRNIKKHNNRTTTANTQGEKIDTRQSINNGEMNALPRTEIIHSTSFDAGLTKKLRDPHSIDSPDLRIRQHDPNKGNLKKTKNSRDKKIPAIQNTLPKRKKQRKKDSAPPNNSLPPISHHPLNSKDTYVVPTDSTPKIPYGNPYSRGNYLVGGVGHSLNPYQQSLLLQAQSQIQQFQQQQQYQNFNKNAMGNNTNGPFSLDFAQNHSGGAPPPTGSSTMLENNAYLTTFLPQALPHENKPALQEMGFQNHYPHPNNNHLFFPSHYDIKSPPAAPPVSVAAHSYSHLGPHGLELSEFETPVNGLNIPNSSRLSQGKLIGSPIANFQQLTDPANDPEFSSKYNTIFEDFQTKFKDLLDGRSEDMQMFYARHMELKMNSLFHPYSLEFMLKSRENPRLTSKPNSRDFMDYGHTFASMNNGLYNYTNYNTGGDSAQSNNDNSRNEKVFSSKIPSAIAVTRSTSDSIINTNTSETPYRPVLTRKLKKTPASLHLNLGQQSSAPFLSPPNTTLTNKNPDKSAPNFGGDSKDDLQDDSEKSDFENESKMG